MFEMSASSEVCFDTIWHRSDPIVAAGKDLSLIWAALERSDLIWAKVSSPNQKYCVSYSAYILRAIAMISKAKVLTTKFFVLTSLKHLQICIWVTRFWHPTFVFPRLSTLIRPLLLSTGSLTNWNAIWIHMTGRRSSIWEQLAKLRLKAVKRVSVTSTCCAKFFETLWMLYTLSANIVPFMVVHVISCWITMWSYHCFNFHLSVQALSI